MNGQPRCPIRGCFVRYRGGPDRLCPIHQEEQAAYDIGTRMDQLGIDMASQPGDYTAAMTAGDGDGASTEVGMAQLPPRPSP